MRIDDLNAGDPPAGTGDHETTGAAVTESQDPVAVALLDTENKLNELNDRYLRLMAEFDNFRRRAARERESYVENGAESVARPLLTVLDNLERAVASAGDAPGPWLAGVSLTLRQFMEALKESDVTPVDPSGQPFNPVEHEALTTAPSETVPADHVALVVSRGYRLNDRILRPAQVIVSSGPSVS